MLRFCARRLLDFFIYASTVIKFVASENDLPSERLAIVTSLPQSTIEGGGPGVNQLYIKVLGQAFCDQADSSKCYPCFQAVMGMILLIFNPLSIKDLSELLGHHPSYIRNTIRSLDSHLLIPDSTEIPVRTFHKSFLDFLTDPNQCKDKRFFIEPTVHHTEIFLVCLNLMGERLKKNICDLDDYTILSEVKNISTYKKDKIGGALEYASHFWTKHLLGIPSSGPHVKEVQEAINKFFVTNFLFRVETLSLMGNLDTGIYALNDIQEWYLLVSCLCYLCRRLMFMSIQAGVSCKWVNDSQCLLLEYFDAIRVSPS